MLPPTAASLSFFRTVCYVLCIMRSHSQQPVPVHTIDPSFIVVSSSQRAEKRHHPHIGDRHHYNQRVIIASPSWSMDWQHTRSSIQTHEHGRPNANQLAARAYSRTISTCHPRVAHRYACSHRTDCAIASTECDEQQQQILLRLGLSEVCGLVSLSSQCNSLLSTKWSPCSAFSSLLAIALVLLLY